MIAILSILGSLIEVHESHKKPTLSFVGLGIKPHERKEYLRHCFLFSGLLLIATKSSNGKLHLHKVRSLWHVHFKLFKRVLLMLLLLIFSTVYKIIKSLTLVQANPI